jgi:regulator of protease activity HflC (stomatin/prohibitin superfamily)
MNNLSLPMLAGVALGIAAVMLMGRFLGLFAVSVEDEEVVLVTTFGKLTHKLDKPGLHVLPSRIFPWVKLHTVSLKRDFRHLRDVHVNDAQGTTIIADLWVEFRITDPRRAVFDVAEWDTSLQNLVAHAATSILGARSFREILTDRSELGRLLEEDIRHETERWGLRVEHVFIRKVSLLPEVSRLIFETVAARLEREKAQINEQGRLSIAKLEAETHVRVAALVADAKAQYPLAVGRAFAALRKQPNVFAAYNELYNLSMVRPHRTIAFSGFGEGELRAVDAAMLSPQNGEAPPALVPPLSGSDAKRL